MIGQSLSAQLYSASIVIGLFSFECMGDRPLIAGLGFILATYFSVAALFVPRLGRARTC